MPTTTSAVSAAEPCSTCTTSSSATCGCGSSAAPDSRSARPRSRSSASAAHAGAQLHVEPDVQHVAVADDVGLALEALLPAARRFRVRARLDQVVPVDHLAADEAPGDVGVNRAGCVERRLAVAQRPGARLLLAGGEERDEVERVTEPADDLLERGAAPVAT